MQTFKKSKSKEFTEQYKGQKIKKIHISLRELINFLLEAQFTKLDESVKKK